MPIYFKVKDRGTIYWCSSQVGMSMIDTSIVTEAYHIINWVTMCYHVTTRQENLARS